MGIQSFLQAERGDPDWQYSPEIYFGKQFKMSEANTIELRDGRKDSITLRLNPTEKDLLAKNLKIDVRAGSVLDLIVINESNPKLQQVFLYDIKIREGALLNLGIFAKGGKFSKHIFQVEIEDGGNLASYGYMSNNVQGCTEIVSKVYQRGSGSLCTQLIGAHAGAESQTVYQGISHIDRHAEQAEVSLESVNLIGGPAGKCYSKPEITSENETARTRYGSQTMCVDSSMLHYLASRGLDTPTAENIVLDGFRKQIFNLIKEEDIRDEVEQLFSQTD
jgi:Fe-S cluster assembly scaffold protein SufB